MIEWACLDFSFPPLSGGVARNVGEALALLLTSCGAPPSQLPLLVSAVGDDLAGRALLQHWQSLGWVGGRAGLGVGCCVVSGPA